MTHDPRVLPDDLVAPVDDGACPNLRGAVVPRTVLESTSGTRTDIAAPDLERAVLFIYPRTGRPGVEPPSGWDLIPGARRCTPQSCGYRDVYSEIQEHGAEVFGLSTQPAAEQREFAEREHIPFPMLSDPTAQLGAALGLPTFTVDGQVLYRRVTVVVQSRTIVYFRYPVFPPDSDAADTLAWLRAHPL